MLDGSVPSSLNTVSDVILNSSTVQLKNHLDTRTVRSGGEDPEPSIFLASSDILLPNLSTSCPGSLIILISVKSLTIFIAVDALSNCCFIIKMLKISGPEASIGRSFSMDFHKNGVNELYIYLPDQVKLSRS